jgi:hypothetical protein
MTLMLASAPYAGTSDPGIQQRERNQQRRIGQGVRSGELTANETRRLEREQAAIRRHEKIMKSDGDLTEQERRRLTREQNRASKDIYRMKHNELSR